MTRSFMEQDVKRIKSRDFALRIIKLYRFLVDKKAFEIDKQILRCGTSIGANVAEAECSESDSDFVHLFSSMGHPSHLRQCFLTKS